MKWPLRVAQGMSGDGFAAKRRNEEVEQTSVNQNQRSLFEDMKSQAGSMLGMAGMFIVTIVLAMKIQPFYDHDELRAYGAAGSTKLGLVLLQLVFILIFTALIIYLARKNMQKFIRWGVLGILWIAMMYTLYPLTAMVLVPDVPALTSEEMEYSESYIITVEEGGADFFFVDDPMSGNETLRYVSNAGEIEHWSHAVMPENEGNSQSTVKISRTADGIIMCEGTQWILLDADDGSVLDDHGKDCDVGLRYEYTDTMDETCDGQDDVPQDWRIIDRYFEPIGYFQDGDDDAQVCTDWVRTFPDSFNGRNVLFVQEIGTEYFLIVSEQWAGMVEYPTGPTGMAFGAAIDTTWNMTLSGDEKFTSATFGAVPGLNSSGQDSILLGTSTGYIFSWDVHENGTVDEGFTMALSEPVRGLLLADCCSGGSNDLWVIEGDNLRIFMGPSRAEVSRSLEIGGTDPKIPMALHNIENSGSNNDDAILLMEQDGAWVKMQYEYLDSDTGIVIYTIPALIALVLSLALMVLLIVQPQWYVINTVGILVGAGTITMLGVTFVPWLIIFFMVLAAIYDAWAVYKSKHMLELADTMVNLELPVMLIAPQKPTRGRIQMVRPEAGAPPPPKRGFDETMLMGLGDVIFPGLLCISAMSFLPEVEGPLGWAGAVWVAIGTMIGSLIGYTVLMTYVARGKPQAGLPLLNGGAILGYFISGMIFIGGSAFVFDVSLF